LSSALYAQNRAQVVRIDAPAEFVLGTSTALAITVRNVSMEPQHIRARIRIDNDDTGKIVYGHALDVMDIPAGKDTTVWLDHYATNVGLVSQRGRYTITATAIAIDFEGEDLGDDLPSDDTLRISSAGVLPSVK
jgi:hypothetical protein